MARIRTIKPEFWTDEKIVQLPFATRLLFIGMWNFADDEGYLEEAPDRLRLQILPNDDIEIEEHIDLLCAAGMIERVSLTDGRSILSLPNFSRHQKISHVTKTKFPVSSGKKRVIPFETRRGVAIKYGCKPGERKEVECYFCGAKGSIWWPLTSKGKPSGWVAFGNIELDHFIPENSGGNENKENIVLSCRYCNRSRGYKDPIQFICKSFPENSGDLPPEGKGRELNGRERILPDLDKSKSVSPAGAEDAPSAEIINIESRKQKSAEREASDMELLDEVTDLWNSWARQHHAPAVERLTKQRASKCRHRIEDLKKYGYSTTADAFNFLLSKCNCSFFARGDPRKPLEFDQLMQEGFMTRMLEGAFEYRKENRKF